MAPWREGALERGYRSLAAFPFAPDTKNAGVITFYASEANVFTDQIIRLLDEQSSDLTFAFVTLDHEEQRISAENDLKKSELQYRRVFETAQDEILILDGDTGAIIDANTFLLDLLGYPLEYCIGKQLWELGFIKDKFIAQNAFTELKTNGYIRYENLPLETKDGRSINVELISNLYLVGDKKIFRCNIRDITDKKVVQAALQASETRYRRLFETAQDAILILDGDTGAIIDANTFILNMLGYPLEYFVGKQLWELGFIKDKSIAQNAFTELKTNEYIRYEDLPLETKDGQSINVEFISNVYLVSDKKIIQCNIRDITARKRAEDALRQATKQLSLLSSITRHDILNQVMALKWYLELSHDVIDKPETLSGYIKKEQQVANTIEAQITFTRDYQNLGATDPAWQNVNASIKKAVAGLPMRDVKIDIDRTYLEIFADPLFEKVFYNLIDNALRYGGDQLKTIRFSSQESDTSLVIVCEDDGVGITDEDKKHLFTRGFGKNTGLGLFLSREILSITGITITENSEPGKGARFEIRVPTGIWRMIEGDA
jgi:PAS domain S-box-containing protein